MKKLFAIPAALVLLVLIAFPALAWQKDGGASCSQVFAKIKNESSDGEHYDGYIKANGSYVVGPVDGNVNHNNWAQVSWNPPANFSGSVEAFIELYHHDYQGHKHVDDSKTVTGSLNCIQHVPVTLCHATSSPTNPFNQITTDDDGALGHAAQHPADIIPPFTYYGGNFPGQNWTTAGQNIWNHGCVANYTTQVVVVKNDCSGWQVDKIFYLNGVEYDRQTASGTWSNPFVLESASAFGQTVYEPKECQQAHQVTWGKFAGCKGYSAFYAIDGGAPVTYASGTWSNIYALEGVDIAAFNFPKNPGELYSVSQIPGQHIDEPKECQQAHTTDKWFESDCTGYTYGYILDGQKVQTGSGTWTNKYAPESVTVTVVVPTNEGEIYGQTVFTFSIDEDLKCVKCRVEIVYPMAAYTDYNAPDNYWRDGTCWVIHPDGQVPSADRVTHTCSLCPKQTADGKGYEYHGMNMYYDGYVVRITCWQQNPTYWYNGEQIPEEWIKSSHFNQKGERIGGCYQSCQ